MLSRRCQIAYHELGLFRGFLAYTFLKACVRLLEGSLTVEQRTAHTGALNSINTNLKNEEATIQQLRSNLVATLASRTSPPAGLAVSLPHVDGGHYDILSTILSSPKVVSNMMDHLHKFGRATVVPPAGTLTVKAGHINVQYIQQLKKAFTAHKNDLKLILELNAYSIFDDTALFALLKPFYVDRFGGELGCIEWIWVF